MYRLSKNNTLAIKAQKLLNILKVSNICLSFVKVKGIGYFKRLPLRQKKKNLKKRGHVRGSKL